MLVYRLERTRTVIEGRGPILNLIVLFGPPAVGKMTVGQELSKLTGYPLLHNHMTVDLVRQFFEIGTPQYDRLVPAFRQMLVAEAAASDLPGLIFTFVWDLGLADDNRFVNELRDMVAAHGGSTYYAELSTGLEERLARNRTENRLRHKRIEPNAVETFMRFAEGAHRMNSHGDFPYPERHVKLDNTHVSATGAAQQILSRFGLPGLEGISQ